ncbi:MAG TPA: ABC transporter permease, partial [Pseudolysinimonas sp.]|nr:ABC transporter permease [Pseudolysinimonas sp.]
WLGVLQGSYLANASAVALAMFAIGATVAGLASVIGRAGLAIGAVTFVLFAVPLASAATPVEFLPQPWGAVGQWFPPGAGATLIRDLSYFPAADTVFPWLVLAAWGIAGAALLVAGRAMDRPPAGRVPASAV